MNTAKIIAVTQPLISAIEGTVNMDPEAFIAYTARVSNPSNQYNTLTAPKLLKYLLAHKHFSPFEMVNVVMSIDTTRDIAHQIVRHRSFSFQEFSQRYADPTKDMGFVTREARLQDHKNRQNSIEVSDDILYDAPVYEVESDLYGNIINKTVRYEKKSLKEDWTAYQENTQNAALSAYQWAIDAGIAKEQARAVLPEGLTKTRLYMSGTLRSWIHYIDVRAEEGTQKEHREIAIQAQGEILTHFPSLEEYWFPVKDVRIGEYSDKGKTCCETCFRPFKDKPWWRFW